MFIVFSMIVCKIYAQNPVRRQHTDCSEDSCEKELNRIGIVFNVRPIVVGSFALTD